MKRNILIDVPNLDNPELTDCDWSPQNPWLFVNSKFIDSESGRYPVHTLYKNVQRIFDEYGLSPRIEKRNWTRIIIEVNPDTFRYQLRRVEIWYPFFRFRTVEENVLAQLVFK